MTLDWQVFLQDDGGLLADFRRLQTALGGEVVDELDLIGELGEFFLPVQALRRIDQIIIGGAGGQTGDLGAGVAAHVHIGGAGRTHGDVDPGAIAGLIGRVSNLALFMTSSASAGSSATCSTIHWVKNSRAASLISLIARS